ncbi:MAG: thioesterase [Clostridium sp.]|nr:thioesterase [Clostridium sp.]
MNNQLPDELSRTYTLTAGETDAQGRLPLPLIVTRVIEVATAHADLLGLGYANLIEHRAGWVLSRLSVEMDRYPRIGETYTFTTYIQSYTRLYSDRCFVITDDQGEEIGHVRSMWAAIDMDKRCAVDLTQFNPEHFVVNTRRQCPIPMPKKIPLVKEGEAEATPYTFKYCDIDFHRHVNTVMYVRLLLNQWPMEFFDKCRIHRFAIAFHSECHFGQEAVVLRSDEGNQSICEIRVEDKRAVAASFEFE